MTFSGALTLTDLNDFIAPSQACIKPVEQVNPKVPGAASTEISIDSTGAYYEISSANESQTNTTGTLLERAQINLNDCLACSGCITSAESVLITLQSHVEVLNFLEANPGRSSTSHKVPVLSIAPQSLASLAAAHSPHSGPFIGLQTILRRVQAFCKQVLGFEHVYDTTFARHIALLEHSREFLERRVGDGKLPMLASACPGWICYAEKAHHEILPFIAGTRSPQQIMGVLVKWWMAQEWGKKPDEIYHVTVMPCYDKKLEASRQEFYSDTYSTRDVDCVITTGELDLMMREKGWNLSAPVDGEDLPPLTADLPELVPHAGTSSGSYLHSLMVGIMTASAEPLELVERNIRTIDYQEFTLRTRRTGEVVFKGAKCYGFRNLQNVVRKVGREAGVQVGRGAAGRMAAGRVRAKMKRTTNGDATNARDSDRGYDYVEVMACPAGCVNGGGQLRPPSQTLVNGVDEEEHEVQTDDLNGNHEDVNRNARWGDREWTKKVEEAYWDNSPRLPSRIPQTPSDDRDARKAVADYWAQRILMELCRPKEGTPPSWYGSMDEEAEVRRKTYFRTQYHAVTSEVEGLAVKW